VHKGFSKLVLCITFCPGEQLTYLYCLCLLVIEGYKGSEVSEGWSEVSEGSVEGSEGLVEGSKVSERSIDGSEVSAW